MEQKVILSDIPDLGGLDPKSDALSEVLASAKIVSFKDSKNISEFLNEAPIFQQAQSIDLSFSDIREKDLNKLLELVPKSCSLNFEGCEKLPVDYKGKKNDASQVFDIYKNSPRIVKNFKGQTDIKLNELEIAPQELDELINNNPNLEKLSLVNCSGLNDIRLSQDVASLNKLTDLTIHGCDIGQGALDDLLGRSGELQKFDLSFSKGPAHINFTNPEKITDLNLDGTDLYASTIRGFLKEANSLENISYKQTSFVQKAPGNNANSLRTSLQRAGEDLSPKTRNSEDGMPGPSTRPSLPSAESLSHASTQDMSR